MVIHSTICPHQDQVSLKTIQTQTQVSQESNKRYTKEALQCSLGSQSYIHIYKITITDIVMEYEIQSH